MAQVSTSAGNMRSEELVNIGSLLQLERLFWSLNLVEGTYQDQRFIEDEAIASPAFPELKMTAHQGLKASM